jgi:prepilin-type processing-associated H-X9-DG protein
MQRFCVPRHNFSINICYVDGHTQSVVLDDLWQQEWHRNWQGKPMKLTRP